MNLVAVILIQASFYALLATGYVLIYRATRVLNLAHGDVMVFGAFLFYQALVSSNGSLAVGIITALAGAALAGAIIYGAVMRPLAGYPVAVGVLATIALGIVLRTVTTSDLVGTDALSATWCVPNACACRAEYVGYPGRPLQLGGGPAVSGIDAVIVLISLLVMTGLPLILERAAIGVEMRGVAENALLAAQRGINIHLINGLSWAAAAVIATIAGIFFAIKVRLGPDIWYVGFAGFAPALIGGMDSPARRRARRADRGCCRGAGSALYRAADRVGRAVLGAAGCIVDPSVGDLRHARGARTDMRTGLPSTLRRSYAQDMALLDSSFVRAWAFAGAALFLLLPLLLSNFWTGVANQTLIAIVGALALNLLMGTTGQISLGHAGFIAAGAFTAAGLVTHLNAPFFVVLAAAACVGAVLGVVVGLPALRLKGLYLAVSTLAAHFVIVVSLAQYQSAISYGAGFTVPSPALAGITIASERSWYYVLLPIATLVMLININWLRSAFGRAFMAICHRDITAELLGINAARYKLLAFGASTALTCFSGALWAYHTGFVSVEAFDIPMLIQYLAMVIIGGLGSVLGAILGAALVIVMPHLITSVAQALPATQALGGNLFELQIGLFGLVMLLFLLLEPRGLAGLWARVRVYFELWPFRHRSWEA